MLNILNNKKSEQLTKITNLQYKNSIQSYIYDVVLSYFEVLDAKITLEQNVAYLEFVKKNLAEIKEKYELRQATKVDLIESQSRYSSAQLDVSMSNNNLSDTKLRLADYIGFYDTKYTIKVFKYKKLIKLVVNEDFNYWLNSTKKNNYDIRISNESYNSSTADVKIARAGHLPTLDLSLSYDKSINNDPINIDRLNKTYRLSLSIPVFQGNLVDAQIKNAKIQQKKSKLSLQKTHKLFVQNTRIAYDRMLFLKKRIKTLKSLTSFNKLKLDTTKDSFAIGIRTSFDVLLASKELHDSEINTKKAIHQYILSYLRLKMIAGTLSESDIRLLNNDVFI